MYRLTFLPLMPVLFIPLPCPPSSQSLRNFHLTLAGGGFGTTLDPILCVLSQSGHGCVIGNHFYGALAWADDNILMATSTQSLQCMVEIGKKHATEKDLIFSTDPDHN